MLRIWIQFLIISITLFCFSCDFPRSVTEIEKHLSPNGEKEITLSRSESSDARYIKLTTKTEDRTIEIQRPIYYEKDWDGDLAPDFEINFPFRRWINDKIFFIGYDNNLEGSKDEILIFNNSPKLINQMTVNADGKYIVYDLQPNETIRIPIIWRRNAYPLIRCSVLLNVDFSDGSEISSSMDNIANLQFIKQDQCTNGKLTVTDKSIQYALAD